MVNLEELTPQYQVFPAEGRGMITELMPLLISGKDDHGNIVDVPRVPISVANVMERRLNSRRTEWKDKGFITGDAIATSPDGDELKIVLDAVQLRELTQQSQVNNNGSLVLGDGIYDTLQGEEFRYLNVSDWFEKKFSSYNVKWNRFWRVLSRDQCLLNEYTDQMYPIMKNRFRIDSAMSFELRPRECNTLRMVYICNLEEESSIIGVGGFHFADYSSIVGVPAPDQSVKENIMKEQAEYINRVLLPNSRFKMNVE
jgi:hypothetical protein